MKRVTLFCDGSSLGNPGFGGWGSILRYNGVEKELSGAAANVTNNQMELQAVIEGLKALKEPCEVELVTDSQYVANSINTWLSGWVKKDFKGIKNKELWMEYLRVVKPHTIKATWVRGHDGHIENERCDKLARDAATKLQKEQI
ncbi:MAG: ribonuclease HI [Sulfurimonas sp.]|nr:ribonuclease HI [Sulfurimonadaceae bacterium]